MGAGGAANSSTTSGRGGTSIEALRLERTKLQKALREAREEVATVRRHADRDIAEAHRALEEAGLAAGLPQGAGQILQAHAASERRLGELGAALEESERKGREAASEAAALREALQRTEHECARASNAEETLRRQLEESARRAEEARRGAEEERATAEAREDEQAAQAMDNWKEAEARVKGAEAGTAYPDGLPPAPEETKEKEDESFENAEDIPMDKSCVSMGTYKSNANDYYCATSCAVGSRVPCSETICKCGDGASARRR